MTSVWAQAFWPSMRSKVNAFVVLGGGFRGAQSKAKDSSGLANTGARSSMFSSGSGSQFQQQPVSYYIAAQNKIAPNAFNANTTSIYTMYDNVNLNPSSMWSGASMASIQDLCGLPAGVDHYGLLVDIPTFNVAYDAVLNGRFDPKRFNLNTFDCKRYATYEIDPGAMVSLNMKQTQKTQDNLAKLYRAPAEPKLRK